MGIRVQPLEIRVPEDDPFKYDLLNRKEQIEALTNIVGNVEGPCVLALDAAWGTGKTTFIRIWEQVLRNQEFPVVYVNAWETDFSGEPFVVLASELDKGLSEYAQQEQVPAVKEAVKQAAKQVIRRVGPGFLRLLAGTLPIVGAEAGHVISSFAEELLTEYPEAEKSIAEFRMTLLNAAANLSKRPLVVFIDELDRCRPSYAIELLEVAKHLFAVDNIVFVLAVNREQLSHSIRAVYGNGFNAYGYLGRFFDLDLRLPEPATKSGFIFGLLRATNLDEYFIGSAQNGSAQNGGTPTTDRVSSILSTVFDSANLGLRDIAQAVHRLGLVCLSLPSNHRSFAIAALVAIIIRTVDRDLYYRFVGGTATDLDVSKALFDDSIVNAPDSPLLEAIIILASQELKGLNPWDVNDISTPLLDYYRGGTTEGTPSDQHADNVMREVSRFHADGRPGGIGFKLAVDRLELLSTEFTASPNP